MTKETEQKIRQLTGELRRLLKDPKYVDRVVDELRDVLTEKNKRYGDSALKPIKVFSKFGAANSISIRLDDKLSRIMNAKEPKMNDVADMMGYLTLFCIANGWLDWSELID